MASSTVNEDDEMEDEAPELNILSSETIRMAIREINRSVPRSPKTRIKLLISTVNFFKKIYELTERKDPRIQRRLIRSIHDLQDMVVGVTNLIISLSASSAHKQISQIYETVYNMGAYLENIIIEVFKECPKQGLTFADTMKDFLYSLMKLSCENGDSWLYSVLISPIVLHILNSFWSELDAKLRTEWCYDVEDLMIPLAKAAFTCGDFYCQHYLVTIFYYWVRWAMPGKAVPILNSVFQCVEKDVRKDLLRLEVEDTELITRNFLNALNTSSKGPRTVIPISCLYMFVCNTEIRPPDHEVNREMDFWVDFSIVSGRLHAYYSIPGEAALASLSIRRDQIDSVCLNWVVNDSQVEDLEQDGDTQSTFSKDEKVLFFHIVLSVDFDAVASDIESLAGKGYRSIYLVFRSGELVEKLMKDMGYSIHECGSRSCQRPRALRRLLATKHKLSYKESWGLNSQVTGLDDTRTSNVSNKSEQSFLNASSMSVISTPCGSKNRHQPSTPSGTENRRYPSTPLHSTRRIRNDSFGNQSVNSLMNETPGGYYVSVSSQSQEQDENLSPTNSPNRPSILSVNRSHDSSHDRFVTIPPKRPTLFSPNVTTTPNISVNASPNVSVNPSPSVSIHDAPNVSVHDFPNVPVRDSPNAVVDDSLNATVHDSVNNSAYDSLNNSACDSPNASVRNSPNASVHNSPNGSVHDSPNGSVHNSPNGSVHDSPNVLVHVPANVLVHDSPNVSVHDSPNASVHDPANGSVHDSPNASVHVPANGSVHDSPNASVHVPANGSVHDSPNASVHDPANGSVHDSPNASVDYPANGSVHDSPNASVHDSPNASVHDSPNASVHYPANGSVYDSPNGSVHDSPNGSVHDSPNGSVHDSPNVSAHESANVSVHDASNVSVPDSTNDLLSGLPDESPSISPNVSVVTNTFPKGSTISPCQSLNLKSISRSFYVSPNPVMNTSIATSCEEPLPPEAREKYAHLYKHVPFNQRQETPKRLKSSKAKISKLMLVRNSSPKVSAPLQQPITPPVSEIGSPQHNILNLTVGADLDATNISDDEDAWPTTPEMSFGEDSDKNDSNDNQALSLSPVFGYSRTLEARGKSTPTVSQHQSFEKSISTVSEYRSQQKSLSEHQPLKKPVSAVSEQNSINSTSVISKRQAYDTDKSVSPVSEQPSSSQKKSTTFSRHQRGKTCYANSFSDWMSKKTEEKNKTGDYDPYDLWTSSEMDDYRDMLFPKAKTYGGRSYRKRKESTRQGGVVKKRRTVQTTTRNRQRLNSMRFKDKDSRKESNSHSLELEFKDVNPPRKNSFFKRRD